MMCNRTIGCFTCRTCTIKSQSLTIRLSAPKMKSMWEISTIGAFYLAVCIFWSPLPIGGNSRTTLVVESSVSCSGFSSMHFIEASQYHHFFLQFSLTRAFGKLHKPNSYAFGMDHDRFNLVGHQLQQIQNEWDA